MSFYVTDCKSIAGETVWVVGGYQRPSISDCALSLPLGCLEGCFGRRRALADFLLIRSGDRAGTESAAMWSPRIAFSGPAAAQSGK